MHDELWGSPDEFFRIYTYYDKPEILKNIGIASVEVGRTVRKNSGKPFKSGLFVEKVVGLTVNYQDPKRRRAYKFSDGSICNIDQCYEVFDCM